MFLNKLSTLLCLILLLTLSGCASRPTMEELEKEAMRTGDWSAVEERQRMDRKMGRYVPGQECPNGKALFCEKKGEREECTCVSANILR